MNKNRVIERVFYKISRRLSLFFGGRTYQWAEREVETRTGTDVKRVGIEELEDEYNIPNGAMYMNPSDSTIPVLKGDREERGIRALSIALQHRIPQYMILVVLTTAIVVVIGYIQNFSWNALGISYDVLGATIVARGVFRTPIEIDNSGFTTQLSGPIGNATEKLVSATETVDGIIGTVLLTAGFWLQFSTKEGAIPGVALIVVVIATWAYVSQR